MISKAEINLIIKNTEDDTLKWSDETKDKEFEVLRGTSETKRVYVELFGYNKMSINIDGYCIRFQENLIDKDGLIREGVEELREAIELNMERSQGKFFDLLYKPKPIPDNFICTNSRRHEKRMIQRQFEPFPVEGWDLNCQFLSKDREKCSKKPKDQVLISKEEGKSYVCPYQEQKYYTRDTDPAQNESIKEEDENL